jgi:hypothetical protein
VIVAVAMVAMIGTTALVVDLGYLNVSRNQLQNVADASALAATRELGHIYQNLPHEEQQGFYCFSACADAIRQAAYDAAGANWAAGILMSLREVDVRIGRWDGENFEPNLDQPDAVEVTARRDNTDGGNGPVGTYFARVLGIDEVPVNAIATAALSGQSTSERGALLFPVTLSKWFFTHPEAECQDYIKFHPTDEFSCGGWTTWFENANTPNLRDILTGEDVSPTMEKGDSINTTGGTIANAVFVELLDLYRRMGCASTAEAIPTERTKVGGPDACVTDAQAQAEGEASGATLLTDDEGNQLYYLDLQTGQPDPTHPRYYHLWETGVPVYEWEGKVSDPCANTGNVGGAPWEVVGYAPVVITDILPKSEVGSWVIQGRVECERYTPTAERGGGGNFGIKGTIPGLVR